MMTAPNTVLAKRAAGPDQTLVSRLAQGDQNALSEFYLLYRRRIMAIALRVVGNPWDAEEVLQDVVWTVFRKVEAFRGDAEFSSWLYRVTHNCAKMLLRKRKRVPLPMAVEHLEPALSASRPAVPDLQDVLAQKQAALQVCLQVEQMDALNRAIFWQAGVDGDPAQEVGDRNGLSVLAVKSRLFRIRNLLRQATSDSAGTAIGGGLDLAPALAA